MKDIKYKLRLKKIRYEKGFKIYVGGHRGLVGSSILRNFESEGYFNFITRTYSEL